MSARLILTSISEGFKTVLRSWMALRRARREAKKGIRVFGHILRNRGIPEEIVTELVATYKVNLKMLSIRNLAQLAFTSAQSPTSSKGPAGPTP